VNLRPVSQFLGRLLLLLAASMLLPGLVSLVYRELATATAFALAAAVTVAAGALMVRLGGEGEVWRREGVLIVAGGWILASIFGALPFIFTGTLLSPVDALFEAASGFTTTGATVLTAIEGADRGLLFWRSFTQWLGGMGIIVLFVALLPELGPGARFLYKLEVPGPTAEALSPRIRDTALVLWRLYLGLTVAETALLMVCGLDLYDALTHTFTTLSTGGFSPYNDSIAAYTSPWVHLVIIVFMVIAGGNFSLYFGLRTRRGWNLLRDYEFRFYLLMLTVTTLVVAADLHWRHDVPASAGRNLLDAAFQVVSIATTTGFATADFEQWPHFSRLLLVALMFVGGCAGSTSGSMKVMRMLIGIRAALREVRITFSPSSVVTIIVGGKVVPEGVVKSVAGFFILFLTSWGVATILLATSGHDPVTAGSAAIATLGNVGPGLGAVGPVENFAFFTGWQKLLMVLLMWLGRLEVYSIAALFSFAFWRR
jgi:trk system potassium uptake protein TrkH